MTKPRSKVGQPWRRLQRAQKVFKVKNKKEIQKAIIPQASYKALPTAE